MGRESTPRPAPSRCHGLGAFETGVTRSAFGYYRRSLSIGKVKMTNRIARSLLSLALVGALAAVATGCGSSSASGGNGLSLVAYSTPKEAYAKLIPAFQQTAAGNGVKFSQSYGASGDQSRSVASGLPADVV